MKEVCGIYKIQNKTNGKCYIGQSVNIYHRWGQHRYDAFHENSQSYHLHLYNSMRKYGLDNFSFEIIEECEPSELNEREVYWINYYNSLEDGYNNRPGGDEPVVVCPEKLYQLWNDGKTVKEIMEELGIGRRTALKWLNRGTNYTPEESIRRGHKGNKTLNPNIGRTVIQYDLNGNKIREWQSQSKAKRETGITEIFHCLRGEYFQAGGFRWGYEGEELPTHEEIKSRSKSTKLNPEDVEVIKIRLAHGETTQSIANDYNMHRTSIGNINRGKKWNDGGVYPIYDRKQEKTNRPELLELII